ncbi:MAG: NIPSNAP family protein [Deltaproteobacteria bacterium]|nr:NIPSNAP family protein [Deltaproteobacteria bacterium]
MRLIEKYGGTHHGYFIPGESSDHLPQATFSFPGLGKDGPTNIAVALFSFSSLESYEAYRKNVSEDPGCKAATDRFNETKCFSSYERNFLIPLFK